MIFIQASLVQLFTVKELNYKEKYLNLPYGIITNRGFIQ